MQAPNHSRITTMAWKLFAGMALGLLAQIGCSGFEESSPGPQFDLAPRQAQRGFEPDARTTCYCVGESQSGNWYANPGCKCESCTGGYDAGACYDGKKLCVRNGKMVCGTPSGGEGSACVGGPG